MGGGGGVAGTIYAVDRRAVGPTTTKRTFFRIPEKKLGCLIGSRSIVWNFLDAVGHFGHWEDLPKKEVRRKPDALFKCGEGWVGLRCLKSWQRLYGLCLSHQKEKGSSACGFVVIKRHVEKG